MSRADINPDSLYWASFNHFEMRLLGQCIIDCCHSGSCDDDVAYWTPKMLEQIEKDNFANKPTIEKVKIELKEYGAWDEEELSDEDANWRRLIWCAACNVAEDDEPDCSEPLRN